MEFLKRETTGLWIIDVQENLFPHVDRSCVVLDQICFSLEAAKKFRLPIVVSEQYPAGLGGTVQLIRERLPQEAKPLSKTLFSGYADPKIRSVVDATGVATWILVGVEAHICVLQTAKDLLNEGKGVVVLNDAVSSRSLYDFSTAMGELRDLGARISSTETIVYELIRDANSECFKELLPLIKERSSHV